MPIIFVERTFDPPVTEEILVELSRDARGCMSMYDIEFLGSIVARDGLTATCVYRALDADAVRNAQRTAGLPFDRVYPGWVFAGQGGNQLGSISPGPEGS
ncbi:MAG: DUF4242 domain-containing protein [Deltaproteobacteria bacterium]|nr:MAG: DUF4242 domain-containing protein [Deltaproteobacteria bacterium]